MPCWHRSPCSGRLEWALEFPHISSRVGSCVLRFHTTIPASCLIAAVKMGQLTLRLPCRRQRGAGDATISCRRKWEASCQDMPIAGARAARRASLAAGAWTSPVMSTPRSTRRILRISYSDRATSAGNSRPRIGREMGVGKRK